MIERKREGGEVRVTEGTGERGSRSDREKEGRRWSG